LDWKKIGLWEFIFCLKLEYFGVLKNTVGKNNFSKEKKKKKTVIYEHNSYKSLYALSRDFKPLAGICTAQQTNWIIKDLILNIPTLSHYSWTKESRGVFTRNSRKKNIKNTDEIKEEYWVNNPLNNEYTNFQFQNSTKITRIGFERPHLNLDINWIIRSRFGFENSSRIAIASNSVTPHCPRFCPCCGHGKQSFQYWILECPAFSQYRTKSLDYLNDLYRLFLNKYNNLFVIHLTPSLEIRKTYLHSFLVEL